MKNIFIDSIKRLLDILLFVIVCHDSFSQKFAIVGDYGWNPGPGGPAWYYSTKIPSHGNQFAVKVVAGMVDGWNPDFILSLGDDSYWCLLTNSFDDNVGPFYAKYIYPYKGTYGTSVSPNRFFPILGNHDYLTTVGGNNCGSNPYQKWLDYFSRTTRYYDFVQGDVHFYALDLNGADPDGVTETSVQGRWLKSKLQTSTSKFNVVYAHQAPYASCELSGTHCSKSDLQWPYKEWGADVVISGDSHFYERIVVNNFTYIINGCGGGIIDNTTITRIPESKNFVQGKWGAMLVTVNSAQNQMKMQMYDQDKNLLDDFTIWPGDRWHECCSTCPK